MKSDVQAAVPYLEPGVSVEVTSGRYQGAQGEYLGLRLGGDVALSIFEASGHDLHEGEILCVGVDEVRVMGPVA